MFFFPSIIDNEALNWEKTRNDIYDEEAFQSPFLYREPLWVWSKKDMIKLTFMINDKEKENR